MVDQSMSQSRLSYSYLDPVMMLGNPLIFKVSNITVQFDKVCDPARAAQYDDMKRTEAERRDRATFKAKRREQGSEMVRKDNPYPELKPSPALTHAVHAQSFNQNWRNEHKRARRANLIAEGRAMVGELQAHKTYLSQEKNTVLTLGNEAQRENAKDAKREAFKALRRVENSSERIFAKVQAVQHKFTDT